MGNKERPHAKRSTKNNKKRSLADMGIYPDSDNVVRSDTIDKVLRESSRLGSFDPRNPNRRIEKNQPSDFPKQK